MNKYVLLIAAVFLVIAGVLLYECMKLFKMSSLLDKESDVNADVPEVTNSDSSEEKTMAEQTEAAEEDHPVPTEETIPAVIEEEQEYGQVLVPEDIAEEEETDDSEFDMESPDAVVDRMMSDIMQSMQTEEGKTVQEEDSLLNGDLLSQIEEINRSAEGLSDEMDTDTEAIRKELEGQYTVPAAPVTGETLSLGDDLMAAIEAVNAHAEQYEEAARNAAAAEEAVPERTAESSAEENSIPMQMMHLGNGSIGEWKGLSGTQEPVLYFFRYEEAYSEFMDAVTRMYSRELMPAYPFYAALCRDSDKEDVFLNEISDYLFDSHAEVRRILIDTKEEISKSGGFINIGVAAGTLVHIQFDEMSELGRTELAQCAKDAEEAGIHCIFNSSGMTITALSNEETDSVLNEVADIAKHYGFGAHLINRQDASAIVDEHSAFYQKLKNAVVRTFRTRNIDAVVLPASEWKGNLKGYEALWFVPSSKRAVSFYLNLLCLG